MTNESTDAVLKDWEGRQSDALTQDPLWTLNCYREALFLIDAARADVGKFGQANSLVDAKEQLITSVGSIAANIAEGYGRPTTADRSRFLSYALGSAREAIAWYHTLRPSVDFQKIDDRIQRLARIRRMLLGLLGRLKAKGARKFDRW